MLLAYHIQKKKNDQRTLFSYQWEKIDHHLEKDVFEKRELSSSTVFLPPHKNWEYYSFIFCKLDLKSGLQLEIWCPNLVISTVSADHKHIIEKKRAHT